MSIKSYIQKKRAGSNVHILGKAAFYNLSVPVYIYNIINLCWFLQVKKKVFTSVELLIPICNLPSTWLCSYQWRKDDVAVRNSRQVAVDSKLGTIVFTRIEMSDYGTYQCFASNQYGTALSPPIEVHEARKLINLITFWYIYNSSTCSTNLWKIVLFRLPPFIMCPLSLGLGSFPVDPVSQDCTKFQHCLIQCRNRPVCQPESQCRVEWKKGPGTDNNVRVSERVAVDGKGRHGWAWIYYQHGG